MNDYHYRTCKECGKKWNVSAKNKDEKSYVCPICRQKGSPQKIPKLKC